jgi:hypothetical protein
MHGGRTIPPPFANGRDLPAPPLSSESMGGRYESQVVYSLVSLHPHSYPSQPRIQRISKQMQQFEGLKRENQFLENVVQRLQGNV